MARWQRTLKLQPEWDKAAEDEITVNQLAGVIARRLKDLRPFGGDLAYLDEARDEIVDEFDWLAKDADAGTDDFDNIMESLYDWADTRLDDDWNGKKVCWVDRFGIPAAA